jgi:hypothetical protein
VLHHLPIGGRRCIVDQQAGRPAGPGAEMKPNNVGGDRSNLDLDRSAAVVLGG